MSLSNPNPERAGMDRAKLDEVYNLLSDGLERGLYTGAALWVSRNDITAGLSCIGHTDQSRHTPVDTSTLFDLASLTKPIATATAVMMLINEGIISLDQRVDGFFPKHSADHLHNVTLFHLMTHTSGLPAWVQLYSPNVSVSHATDRLLQIPLKNAPGTHYEYSCLGYILLGLIVESVSGERLDSFVNKRIFEPLGMHDTMFNPRLNRPIASTGFCPYRGRELRGEVHDSNACAFGGISGNAGLFSSVQDMSIFCQSITNTRQSCIDLPSDTLIRKRFFDNALPDNIGGHTLSGWFISPNSLLPVDDFGANTTIGHSGFTGTAIIINPCYNLCSAILTNRTCNPDDGAAFRTLRRRVLNGVLGAIVW